MIGPLAKGEFDITIIGTVGIPAAYGGFETLAEQLCRRLAAKRRMQVFCSRAGGTEVRAECEGAALSWLALRANGAQSIPYDGLSMLLAARQSRALLVLGVSGGLFLPLVRLWSPRTRIVTNIDGIEWRRSKWGGLARWVLRTSERLAVRNSHAVVADNEGIREHLRSEYGIEACLIAYGGDSHSQGPPTAATTTNAPDAPYFLSLCRIEPENNMHLILEAFASLPDKRLIAVGNWDHSEYGRHLRAQYAGKANISMMDPVYDPTRVLALRSKAAAYIHGHSAGGTNPSLVEAMYNGAAVIAYDVNFNRHTTDGLASFWKDSPSLAALITHAKEAELQENARMMRQVAVKKYQWNAICEAYDELLRHD